MPDKTFIDLYMKSGLYITEIVKRLFVKTFFPDDYQRLGWRSLNQKQLLEQHRTHIIQKINQYGTYDDLEVSAIIPASQREHILKKYIWALSFHNYVCMIYNLPECMIESRSGCDIRFMRMTLEISGNE